MAKKDWCLPKTQRELDDRELAGLWKAIGLVKDIAESNERITLDTIRRIHKTIFEDAEPEIAGRFRKDGENVKKLKCIEPPPGHMVSTEVFGFWRELDHKMALLPRRPVKFNSRKSHEKWFSRVLELAVWAQHKFVAIHPFPQGNGRTARLLTNLVLQRYEIKPSQVKYEGEMKGKYLEALCQADKYNDYEPLKRLALKSIIESYQKEERLRKKL